MAERTRLIVDTDTAGDDVFSLLLALRRPEAQLDAITVVCGNVRFEQQIENALLTVERAGRAREVPVYAGCSRPLLAEWVGAEYVHGEDGMGDSFFPPVEQRPEAEHAVDAIVRLVAESPGEISILAQGPLTNIATAVVRDPSLAENVRHVCIMGGGVGYITPAAEFNFYVDPEAAKIVLQAGFPITLFTWTVTLSHGVFDDAKLAEIEALDTELSRFFQQVNRKALEFERSTGIPGSTHPDAMTCAALLDESLIVDARDCVVDVETRGELTRGYSVIDAMGRIPRRRNVRVVEAFDTDRFFRMMVSVLE